MCKVEIRSREVAEDHFSTFQNCFYLIKGEVVKGGGVKGEVIKGGGIKGETVYTMLHQSLIGIFWNDHALLTS